MHQLTTAIFLIVISAVHSASLGKTPSVYEQIIHSTGEQYKCPYLREILLKRDDFPFLEQCKYSAKIYSSDDQLCLLYYNNFMELCYYSGIYDTKMLLNESTVKASFTGPNIKTVCENLNTTKGFFKDLNKMIDAIVRKLQKDKFCEDICTGLENDTIPICIVSALMRSVSAQVSQLPIPAKIDQKQANVAKNISLSPEPIKTLKSVAKDTAEQITQKEISQATVKAEVEAPVVGPQKGASVVEPPKGAPVVEPHKGASVVEPHKGASVVEPPKGASGVEPPKGAPVVEPPKGAPVVDVPRTVQVADVPKTVQVAESEAPVKITEKVETLETPEKKAVEEKPADASSPAAVAKMPDVADTDFEQEGIPPGSEEDIENADDIQLKDDDTPPEEKPKISTNTKPKETYEEHASLSDMNSSSQIEEEDSFFFMYFMMVCAVFIIGYIGYHNKQKVLALVIEGRRGRRGSRRAGRPNSANYHKLDSNLEEAVTSGVQKNPTNVIY